MSPKIIMTIIVVLVVSGCATYAPHNYSVSAYNITALKEINGLKLNVGSFTASKPEQTGVGCLLTIVKTPNGQTFENFIRDAFVNELKTADAYYVSAPITLTGNLDALDFEMGMWDLALTVNSSNGNSFSVSERYSFIADHSSSAGCYHSAHALVPAVQNLIGKVVTNSEFGNLIN